VLRRTSADNELSVKLCGMLERQVQQMARLIDDLLDVSRIARGTIRFRFESIDLADAVSRAVEMSEPALTRRRHRLRVEMPSEPLPIDGDAARLAQMIVNLLDNAAKYTPEGGAITLRVRRAAALVELCVEDSGIGIAPEMLPKIFGPFVQARRPASGVQDGLGIGLTLVQVIAEHHGGSVEASSAGAGKGSAFVVRLPALREAPAYRRFG
jgi:signal transduction histidine kinase